MLLAKYPFLQAAKQYVKEEAPTIQELLTDPLYERARLIGVERLDNAFQHKDVGDRSLATDSDCIMELLSYPIARMIAVCINDTYFKRRYALGEAIHMYKNLIKEQITFLLKVANEFGMDVTYADNTNTISIYFTDYLHYAPTRYKEWKMINREMNQGYITVSKKDLARILQEALRERINTELDNRLCHDLVSQVFSSDVQRIKNKIQMHRKEIETAPVGKLEIEKLPPCIKDILVAIQTGENVPHMGRFALVAFLSSIKLNTKEIIKVFSTAPDFEEEKTRYQIEHITGSSSYTAYTPPGCDKMRTYGICPSDKIDELCKKTRHPLSYYKTKWKQQKREK